MNKILKTVLLGLIIWVIPFLASFVLWDPNTNAPYNSAWFYAVMGFTGVIGFSIAAFFQFKSIHKNTVKEGWIAGIIWYIECLLLDFIVLGQERNGF